MSITCHDVCVCLNNSNIVCVCVCVLCMCMCVCVRDAGVVRHLWWSSSPADKCALLG